MRLRGNTTQRFTMRNAAFAGLGFASLIILGLAIGMMMAAGPEGTFGVWLFISSPVLGLVGVILNIQGLARIREGQAGDYDLILTWPGFFGASFTCLFTMVMLLTLVFR
jgi:hypothetical protein